MGIIRKRELIRELIWLAQVPVVGAAVLTAAIFRFGWIGAIPVNDRLFSFSAAVLWLLAVKLAEDNRLIWQEPGKQMMRLLKTWLAYIFALLVLLVGIKLDISRVFLGVFSLSLLLYSLLARFGLLWYARQSQKEDRVRVLLVGSGEMANYAVRHIEEKTGQDVQIIGILGEAQLPGIRWLGTVNELGRVLHEEVVDEILIAMPLKDYEEWKWVIDRGEEEGKTVHLLANLGEKRLIRGQAGELADLPVISYMPSKQNIWQRMAKRAFDVVFSSLVLIGGAPVFLLIAILIKLDSKGPVFFIQPRVGLNGRIFKMIKFRTMVPDAEARLKEVAHLNEMDGPVFKITNDPRITRVGKFLRKTSLDELPQFINVLLGDMSVVGPRPALPREVAQYDSRYRRRLSVKPGITCIWQVSGRNDVSFEEWMGMDMEYIDRASLWLDLALVVKTVFKMAEGK
ncbi:exopolysaccharide biosynthesis polyprenyl glycosylphosphotransferase [Carboxydocella thermautotrophica]|nr:exopolysaccharide biosynthesis polyprenyl glycosylphosphotransferase [Carboxydocella thermautotrophica]